MKAIIIQDHDARALLDQLKLEVMNIPHIITSETLDGPKTREQLTKDIHGRFHYIVTRWLQEQGATIIR